MLYALLSTFLNSAATIFWKKALTYKASDEIFQLLAYTSVFFITSILYFIWFIDLSNITLFHVTILFFMVIAWFFRTVIMQKAYATDKISTLMPYENINKILSIVLAFFIFWDISTLSLLITLIAIIVIISFTIDRKTLKIPKTIKLFAFSQSITSILTLLAWYLLITISESAYFIITYVIWIMFVGSIVIYKKKYLQLKELPIDFYKHRLAACHLWWSSYLLWILVIKNLWVSISILLSFVWIWITLLFSYIFFKDKPSKKDLLLTIIVSALVWLWYYYK